MTLTEMLIAQLEREAPRTRAVLEQIPTDKADWTPHQKSTPLGRLAGLVATMPSWVGLILNQDELDLTPPPGQGTFQPPPLDQLVAAHDKMVSEAVEALERTHDDFLLTSNWRLKARGHVVMDQPRHIVLVDTMSHWSHHRGQLTVYLRLTDQTVPSVYGPSADDQTFR